MKKFHCVKPCSNCPFRKDTLKNWLSESIDEILKSDSFICHKTLDKKIKLQCAGHLILNKEDNVYNRMAQALNIDLGLKNQDLIFETKEDCINHHKN